VVEKVTFHFQAEKVSKPGFSKEIVLGIFTPTLGEEGRKERYRFSLEEKAHNGA
jgi:hypothetical protein